MKTIEIEGVSYSLDLDKCIRDGYIQKELAFKVGGVYVDPQRETNSFLLVQPLYVQYNELTAKKAYALLGLKGGFASNSGPFFDELHTKEEILAYLKKQGMKFSYEAQPAIEHRS
jgi:hypothetical protein